MADLRNFSDFDLAQWQAGHQSHTGNYILAEREWERRMISHQLAEQYNLDDRLAKASEAHSASLSQAALAHAERLSKITRWWSVAVAFIGIIGSLLGVWLGQTKQENGKAVAAVIQKDIALHEPPTASVVTAPAKIATLAPRHATPSKP